MTSYTLDQLAAVVAREHMRENSKDYEWHCGLCNKLLLLPPPKRHNPSDADETGTTLDGEPTTSPAPTDDETSPLE